jgi:hypothetical protein
MVLDFDQQLWSFFFRQCRVTVNPVIFGLSLYPVELQCHCCLQMTLAGFEPATISEEVAGSFNTEHRKKKGGTFARGIFLRS